MKNCRWSLPSSLVWIFLAASTTNAFVAPKPSIRPLTHQLAMVRLPFLGKETSNETAASATETKDTTAATTQQQQFMDPVTLPEEEKSETENLMQKVKDSGLAGVVSYALWELAFWAISVPVCIIGYQQVTGHMPDLNDKEDIAKLSAEAFAFVNFARFAVPLRIGLALSTTPWIQENIIDKIKKDGDDQ